uniref:Uncharacterized protein n=1 Tax=Glossina brevipalpis TaxID=37001 RepID=A0A1A9X4T0_9MUSC
MLRYRLIYHQRFGAILNALFTFQLQRFECEREGFIRMEKSDSTNVKYLRYRDADGFWNILCAVAFVVGILLCVVIVDSNLFDICVLCCCIDRSRTAKRYMTCDTNHHHPNGDWRNGTQTSDYSSSCNVTLSAAAI